MRLVVLAALIAATARPAPAQPGPAKPAPGPTESGVPAPRCAVPNVPGKTLRAAQPPDPEPGGPTAAAGTVLVIVALDASSHLTSVKVQSSPGARLNGPALDAARHSAFQTAIRNCAPVAGSFIFGVTFDAESEPTRYSLADTAGLYHAVVADAVRNSEADARRFATKEKRRLGAVVNTDATYSASDTQEPGALVVVRTAAEIPPPAAVELQMRVSVFYALR